MDIRNFVVRRPFMVPLVSCPIMEILCNWFPLFTALSFPVSQSHWLFWVQWDEYIHPPIICRVIGRTGEDPQNKIKNLPIYFTGETVFTVWNQILVIFWQYMKQFDKEIMFLRAGTKCFWCSRQQFITVNGRAEEEPGRPEAGEPEQTGAKKTQVSTRHSGRSCFGTGWSWSKCCRGLGIYLGIAVDVTVRDWLLAILRMF